MPYRFRSAAGRAISVEFDFMPGKRISTGCYDMAGAVLFAEDYIRGMGMPNNAPVPTMREFCKDFFTRTGKGSYRDREKAFGRDKQDAYYTRQQARVDNNILPAFGPYLVSAVTQSMIEEWVLTLRGADGEPLADDTRNKCLMALRIILDEAKRQGIISGNPARDVRRVAVHAREREALPPLMLAELFPSSPEERISVWGSAMWAVYFSIAYDTGMRPGEIAALRVCDIYKTPTGLAVATSRSVCRNGGGISERVKTTGKGYSQRAGLLYWDSAELLVRYLEDEGLEDEDMLFAAPGRKDGLVMPDTSNRHFKDTLKRMGLYREGLTQYCLRHTYATERRGDVTDSDLAISMGHTKLREGYDHQKALDLIRRLDAVRDRIFESRERAGGGAGIAPLKEAGAGKKA